MSRTLLDLSGKIKEEALLADENFDLEIAGARLRGRNIAAIAKPQALAAICGILEQEVSENDHFKLVEDMTPNSLAVSPSTFEKHLTLVQKLLQGLSESSR